MPNVVKCGSCGGVLNERSDAPPEQREPCRSCGSTGRTFEVGLAVTLTVGSSVSAKVPVPPATARAGGFPPRAIVHPPTPETDYGWTIECKEEADGTVLAYLLDVTTRDVLKTGRGSDLHDAVLDVMKDTWAPSEEVRREQRRRARAE
jgi:hypothetical protein